MFGASICVEVGRIHPVTVGQALANDHGITFLPIRRSNRKGSPGAAGSIFGVTAVGGPVAELGVFPQSGIAPRGGLGLSQWHDDPNRIFIGPSPADEVGITETCRYGHHLHITGETLQRRLADLRPGQPLYIGH